MNRNLIIVAFSLMTWGIGEGMFIYFEPLYLEELGANPVMIGTVLGVIGFAMTISHLPAGYLSDRIGRRPLLIAAWIMGTATTCIMALSKTLPWFIVGSTAYGLTSFVISPLNSYVTAARGNLRVGRALTLISASFNIGAILGPALGGYVGNLWGLRTNFQVAAFFLLLSTILIFRIEPQPVEVPTTSKMHAITRQIINPRFLLFFTLIFIAIFCMYIPQPLTPNYLQNERGINLATMGLLISARGVGVVILNLLLGQLIPRVGFILAGGAVALSTLFFWNGTSSMFYLLGYLLFGGYQTARSLIIAQGRSLVDSANMGFAYGIFETGMSTAIILAPPLAGLLYSKNPTYIYSISFGLILIALVLYYFFSPIRSSEYDEIIEPSQL